MASKSSGSAKPAKCLVCDKACLDRPAVHDRCVLAGFAWLTMMWLYLGIQETMQAPPGLRTTVAWKSRRYAALGVAGRAGSKSTGRGVSGAASGRFLLGGR